MPEFTTRRNLVLVKPDKNIDHFTLAGGIQLHARTDINPQNYWSVTGTVVAIPDELVYNGHKTNALKKRTPEFAKHKNVVRKLQELNNYSTNFDVPMELLIGDKVYFNYVMHDDVEESGRKMEIDGETYYFLPYDQVYCAKRGKEVVMLNGYVLVEPIGLQTHDIYSASGIKLSTQQEGENKPGFGRVRYVGTPCGGYLGYREWIKDEMDLKAGDEIIFKKNGDVPLEWRYLETFDGQTQFFQMQRRDIYAIIN